MAATPPPAPDPAQPLDSCAERRDHVGMDPADYRVWEESLLKLCAEAPPELASWHDCGNLHFLAGLALMLASATGFDRQRYLALAKALDPTIMSAESFEQWLAESPVKPSRFLPLLRAQMRHGLAH